MGPDYMTVNLAEIEDTIRTAGGNFALFFVPVRGGYRCAVGNVILTHAQYNALARKFTARTPPPIALDAEKRRTDVRRNNLQWRVEHG
jgi:hypothetical protein